MTELKSETNEDGEEVKYYEITEGDELKKKVYCPFEGRGGLEQAIKRRRSSLHRAIETYMEEVYIGVFFFQICFLFFWGDFFLIFWIIQRLSYLDTGSYGTL